MFSLFPQQPQDSEAIELLLDRVFGPGRRTKSSYRFRAGVEDIKELAFVARLDDGRLAGTIRYWPIRVGNKRHPALLLGPLGVEPELKNLGIGSALMRHTLDLAARAGHDLACLVGDLEYYRKFGFVQGAGHGIWMAGESDRFLVLGLREGVPGHICGEVLHWMGEAGK